MTDRTGHIWKLLRKHVLLLLILGALCLYGCPFYRLLGLSCPGCGLTRAWLCFLRGEWAKALEYHLLFLPAPLFLLLAIHRDAPALKNTRFLPPLLFLFSVLLIVYHLIRSLPPPNL